MVVDELIMTRDGGLLSPIHGDIHSLHHEFHKHAREAASRNKD